MNSGKRKVRNVLAGILGLGIRISGAIGRAEKKIFSGNNIIGIYFHNPNKNLFRKCIKWFKKNDYTFISIEQLVDIIKGNSVAPKKSVWISFDDGWKANLDNVIPIIIEYDIPVTFFISTDPVKNDGIFWWSYARKFRNHLPDEFKNNIDKLLEVEEKKRKKVIDNLRSRFSKNLEREAMNIQDIKDISKIPQITIGCHTVNHAITKNCTDTELEFEIKNSKTTIETWINKDVKFFSYPNGDFDGREVGILRKNNFELAAIAGNRFISVDDNQYLIPRFTGIDDGYFHELLCHIMGVWYPIKSKMRLNLDFIYKPDRAF